jgi:hypothetical protein
VLDDSFPTMGTVARVVRDADGGLDVRSVFAEIDRSPRSTTGCRASTPAAICRA